jgi:hypothetical protein
VRNEYVPLISGSILKCSPPEFADISETIFKEFGNFSLMKVLRDPKVLPYLISLSITDQPAERPTLPSLPEERERHVNVKLSVPSGSQVNDTKEFVSSIFQLVDIVGTKFGSTLRPDTKSKLRKTREELENQLRVEAKKEKKDEVCCFSPGVVHPLRVSSFRLKMRSGLRNSSRNGNVFPGSALQNNKR